MLFCTRGALPIKPRTYEESEQIPHFRVVRYPSMQNSSYPDFACKCFGSNASLTTQSGAAPRSQDVSCPPYSIYCHPNTLFRNLYGDMMTIKTMPAVKQNDAEPVADSLNGSRDAFCCIVERYQTLICSLAYSATGSVSRSEDMAQETFLAA